MSKSTVATAQTTSPTHEVGPRLRRLRNSRRLTLRAVADAAALSESFLSQVERGKASPSVASLRRIADTLGVGVGDLFDDGEGASRVLRHADRDELHFGEGVRKWLLTPRPLHALEVLFAAFAPGGSTGPEPYTHGDAEEVFVVLEGRVELEVDGEISVLGEGDSAHYRSSLPHRAANVGPTEARVLYAMTPPTF